MNILWLYESRPGSDSRALSRRIHYDFVVQLQKFANLKVYGPREHKLNKKSLSPLKFDSKRSMKEVVEYFQPDIVIAYSIGSIKNWVPEGFKDHPVPRVLIEVDYWFWKRYKHVLYKDWHFDLIIQRGAHTPNETPAPSVWLPFSAHDTDFAEHKKVKLKDRKHRIAMVGRGSKFNFYYPIRARAVNTLKHESLIDVEGVVGHRKYPKKLGEYFCLLADSGRVKSPPAKVFEIMASRTLLLTTHFKGYDVLFGEKNLCKFYPESCKHITHIARQVYSKQENWQNFVYRAGEHVDKKHMHKHRIVELYEILKAVVQKKPVPVKWPL